MNRKLSPSDFLAYVLVGDWNSDRYSDLDADQVSRMAEIVMMIAEQRMVAAVELPPISQVPPKDDQLRPPGGANLN